MEVAAEKLRICTASASGLQTEKLWICTASASGLQTNNVGVIEAVEAAEAAEGILPSGGHISQCVILRQFFIY